MKPKKPVKILIDFSPFVAKMLLDLPKFVLHEFSDSKPFISAKQCSSVKNKDPWIIKLHLVDEKKINNIDGNKGNICVCKNKTEKMKIISKNKIAYHDYAFEKDYEVGIILKGHEVKSIKSGQVNLKDSVVRIQNRELWIKNMDVPLYKMTSPNLVPGYNPKGDRKLLITKRELAKISALTDKPGNVLIPLEIYINNKGLIKIKIGVGKLMRKVEKKQILKEKDIQKQMDRDLKNY